MIKRTHEEILSEYGGDHGLSVVDIATDTDNNIIYINPPSVEVEQEAEGGGIETVTQLQPFETVYINEVCQYAIIRVTAQ